MKNSFIFYILPIILFISCKEQRNKPIDTSNNLSLEEKPINIDSFLEKPFDLYAFKQKSGQPNSSGGSRQPYHATFGYKGMYYSYFIFSHLHAYYKSVDDASLRLSTREDELEITVYKQLGKYKDKYIDPTEQIVEVKTKSNYCELPELAFIGLDTSQITQKLGKKSFSQSDCWVYTRKHRALILKLQDGVVSRLKYIHLNIDLQKDSLDKNSTLYLL